MSDKGHDHSKWKQHPNKDHAYFDRANLRWQKKLKEYLDPIELQPPHEQQRQERHEGRAPKKPEDHELPDQL